MNIKIILIVLCFWPEVWPQVTDTPENIIEDKLHNDETNESGLVELLEYFLENPVDINKAGVNELAEIPYISRGLAEKIIEYREKNGTFFSVSELYMLKDIPEYRMKEITPFLKVNFKIEDQAISFSDYHVEIRSRFSKKDLHDTAPKQWSHLQRIKLLYNDRISAGFLTEKDEGENSATDFISGSIVSTSNLLFDKIILGDFLIESGQGLLFWGPYGMPKSSEVIRSVNKKARGVTGYHSSNESRFFRGLAAEKRIGNFSMSGFYSSRKLDAVMDPSGSILSFPKDGRHITSSQIQNKDAVSRKTSGGSVKFENEILLTEFSFHNTFFSGDYLGFKNYNGYSLAGKIRFEELAFFGETTFQGKSKAFFAGIVLSPFDKFEFITAIRNYDPGYINFYGWGFGEKSGVIKNEKGLYSGMRISSKIGQLSVYFDQYSFLSPENLSHNSLKGNDILVNIFSRINTNLSLNIKYKYENKDELVPENISKIIISSGKQNIRSDISYRKGRFNLKFRGEFVGITKPETEKGILLMQETGFEFSKEISVKGRISFFRTDSFSSAVYQYESGIPGMMESSVLSGEGIRLYLTLKIKMNNYPAIYLKYSDLTNQQGFMTFGKKSLILQIEWK
jgi:hypothetical protein